MSERMNHPEEERLQALAAEEIDSADAAVLRSHLEGCGGCRQTYERWQELFTRLESLPRFAPSGGFADAVMARVAVPERESLLEKLLEWLDGLVPRTTRGWSLAAAMMAVPLVIYGGAAAWLAGKPWFSPSTILLYVRAHGGDWLAEAGASITAYVASTVPAQAAVGLIESTSTGTLGLALAGFASLTAVSGWVLYRHLIRTNGRRNGPVTIYAF